MRPAPAPLGVHHLLYESSNVHLDGGCAPAFYSAYPAPPEENLLEEKIQKSALKLEHWVNKTPET